MPKKLAICMAVALLLSGCGAAPAECADMAEAATNKSAQFAPAGVPHTESAVSTAGGDYSLTDEASEERVDAVEPMQSPAAETTPSEAEYFVFERLDLKPVEEDGVTVLYEKACNSTFSSMDAQLHEWVNGILANIHEEFSVNSSNLYEYAREFLELNGAEHFYTYSNYQELGIARHDERVVSLLSLSSLYSGGVHPNAVQSAYNLDLQNHRLLRLEDVIDESGAGELEEMVFSVIRDRFRDLGEGALFEDYPDTIKQSMSYGSMTPYWYLNDVGLVVFYNQYELGPYAAGIIKVELPYKTLEGILLSEYLPDYDSGVPGNLVIRGDWEGYRKIPISIEAEGERLLVGVEGLVFQIQLSEIYWLEQTPIMQEILFSAASLGQNDVLEIQGGFTDAGRSFAIEFINGQGEQKVYYIHADGLSEQP